ncbi:MAG: leucine-rich repeat domain-containing protein, partial [Oscillospiraceae bacterium]|nr:leucine-rich repeat domain-containing protein [Oscillospiraceae bacterium]
TVPKSVETIGEAAFCGCPLEKITLPFIGYKRGETGSTSSVFGYIFGYNGSTTQYYSGSSGYSYAIPSTLKTVVITDETVIPNGAFSNCTELTSIEISGILQDIKNYAFANCTALKSLYIPPTVTSIGSNAFQNDSNLMFYCALKSYAAVYAIDHNIPFTAVGDDVQTDSAVIDETASYYKVNLDGVSVSGYLSMMAGYAFRKNAAYSNAKLVFNLPKNAELVESSLKVDGVLCRNYSFEDGILTIPVTASSGEVRFSLKPIRYEQFSSYCKLNFREGNSDRSLVLGVVHAELPVLSIVAKGETSALAIEVNGVTIPENSVDLYVNGQKQTTVTANKAGDYYATLSLNDASDGKRFVLSASTQSNGNPISAQTTVIYREGSPVLTQFVMEHNGQSFDLQSLNGTKPIVTFAPGRVFRFTVKFDQVSAIEAVYIVSTRNNVKNYLCAEWDVNTQSYRAEGLFDPYNSSYVPGMISVEYMRKSGALSFAQGYDFTTDECINALPEAWKSAEIEVHDNSEKCSDVSIYIPEQDTSLRITAKQQPAPEGITQENAESFGYIKTTDSYGKTVFAKYYEKPEECGLEILDFKNNVLDASLKWQIGELIKGSGTVISAYEVYSAFFEGAYDEADYSVMRNSIERSKTLTDEQKSEAIKKLNLARAVNACSTLGKWAGTAVGAIAGIALGPMGSFAVACGVAFTDTLFDWMRESEMNQMLLMMHELQKFGFGFRWAVDPSGYVFDSTTGARLSGVTATAYWIPYDESQADFWDNTPDSGEYGVIWDSVEYSQLNPLTTDLSGCYSWDVPEGWWRVKYEKEGYETVWSDWMTVPPIQTEVNIGMVSTAAVNYSMNLKASTPTSVTATLTNDSDVAGSVRYVIAAYQANGQMVATGTEEISLTASGQADLTVTYDESEAVAEIRVFVLNVDTLAPLCGAWVCELE